MNVISGIGRWLRERWNRPDADEPGGEAVDSTIEPGFRRFKEVDPETERQWQRLNAVLGGEHRAKKPRPSVVWVPRLKPAISFAAALVVLVVAGILWLPRTSAVRYATAKGQHSTITLSDSTVVTLNHTSELTVERGQTDGTRLVALKGEAFFHVKGNGSPFVVTTDVGTVRVLGTEFNVQVRDNRLEVAVVRGKVRVDVDRSGRDSAVVLHAGEITTCSGSTFPRSPEELLFSGYPGWMHGKFMFYRTDLRAACAELEAQFDVMIRVESHRSESITGVVDGRSAEAAVSTLARLVGNRYRYENGTYILF